MFAQERHTALNIFTVYQDTVVAYNKLKRTNCSPYPVYCGHHQLPPSLFHPGAPYFGPVRPPPDPPTIVRKMNIKLDIREKLIHASQTGKRSNH